jgi:hypothetical protein
MSTVAPVIMSSFAWARPIPTSRAPMPFGAELRDVSDETSRLKSSIGSAGIGGIAPVFGARRSSDARSLVCGAAKSGIAGAFGASNEISSASGVANIGFSLPSVTSKSGRSESFGAIALASAGVGAARNGGGCFSADFASARGSGVFGSRDVASVPFGSIDADFVSAGFGGGGFTPCFAGGAAFMAGGDALSPARVGGGSGGFPGGFAAGAPDGRGGAPGLALGGGGLRGGPADGNSGRRNINVALSSSSFNSRSSSDATEGCVALGACSGGRSSPGSTSIGGSDRITLADLRGASGAAAPRETVV